MSHKQSLLVLRSLTSPLIVLLLVAASCADDLDNIVFEGVIKDTSGSVIVAATVSAVQLATGVERTADTDERGRYRITVSEPGTYQIKVIVSGFSEQKSKEITTVAGRTFVMDLTIVPSGVSEQVTVTASAPQLVDTNRTVVGDTLAQRELDELPIVSRDPLQLVFLLGGVAEAPLSTAGLADEGRGFFVRGTPEEAGSFSLTGAPATSNNITIDGLDNNDDRSARERISLNVDSVAEVQIITNQYAAEYGRASGGRINLRTQAGTNVYHANLNAYFNDEALNANTFSRNARGLGRLSEQQRREAATLSGPVRKNRDFFFASFERFDFPDFAEISASVPIESNPSFPLPKPNQPVTVGSATGLFKDEIETPETTNLTNLRIDTVFSPTHNAVARIDSLRGQNGRGFPGGTRLPETILVGGRNSFSIGGSDYFVLGTRFVNQAKVQYSQLTPRSSSIAGSIGVVIESPKVTAGQFTGSDSSPAFAREERRVQLQDNIAMSVGTHILKSGVDAQLIRSTFTDMFATEGEFTFAGVDDFLTNSPNRFVQRFNTTSRAKNDVIGLFMQDEWKVRPNLTLSLGVRWDAETILSDRNNISPRIAIAWDPFGGTASQRLRGLSQPGKTVVRAGFGLFYNRALLRTIDDFALGRTTTIVDSDLVPAVLDAVKFPRPLSNPKLISDFGIRETSFLRRVSPALQIPYTVQTGLGIERQLGANLVATVDYIFTRGAHLWRETNINAPALPIGFRSFTEYLESRDFDNRPDSDGRRPVSSTSADVVRFDNSANTSSTPGAVKTENGVRVLTLGLNAPRSSNIAAALKAIRFLRPDPSLTQVELLESTGNSFYHGAIFAMRYALGNLIRLRATYTLSKFVDEGTTNTASPQDLFDRRAERALSLQDQRHKVTVSGQFEIPIIKVGLAPIISFGSSRPFNIGAGVDRNLNDIENDRPLLVSQIGKPSWRQPGSELPEELRLAFDFASIGSNGNLPRNYGRGPGTRVINLRASRKVMIGERITLRPTIDVFNVFNNTVFSFGSEFIDSDDPDFLVPKRTQRPRSIVISLKVLL